MGTATTELVDHLVEDFMSTYVEQFSVFTAAILEKLYDSFPIAVDIRVGEFVESPDIGRLFAELDSRLPDKVETDVSFARAEVAARESAKIVETAHTAQTQREIFRGTIEFLIDENFVRCREPFVTEGLFRECQLTAKGFTHLHVEFKDKTMNPEGSAIIRWIKQRFSTTSSIEGAAIVACDNKVSWCLGQKCKTVPNQRLQGTRGAASSSFASAFSARP